MENRTEFSFPLKTMLKVLVSIQVVEIDQSETKTKKARRDEQGKQNYQGREGRKVNKADKQTPVAQEPSAIINHKSEN